MALQELHNGNDDGVRMGQASTDLIGFLGATSLISRRAAAAQATSLINTASSTAITSDHKALLIEIANTFIALGLWKGSA